MWIPIGIHATSSCAPERDRCLFKRKSYNNSLCSLQLTDKHSMGIKFLAIMQEPWASHWNGRSKKFTRYESCFSIRIHFYRSRCNFFMYFTLRLRTFTLEVSLSVKFKRNNFDQHNGKFNELVRQFVVAKMNVTRSILEHEHHAKAIEGDSACCVARNYITVISARWVSHDAVWHSIKACKCILQTKYMNADQFRLPKTRLTGKKIVKRKMQSFKISLTADSSS